MLKMLRCRLVVLVSLLVLCGSLSCATKEVSPEKSGAKRFVFQRFVSPELLEYANLKVEWENKLPIKTNERLERLFILGNRIYALSDRNYMVSLNRGKGNVVFSKPFAPAGFIMLGLEHYKDELISILGSKLVELSPEFGTELRSKPLGFGVTCPATRNSSYFYVAGADMRLRTLRAKDKVKLFEVATKKPITSIVADDGFVVFATDAGNVVAMAPDRPKQLWRFDAADGIVGPIVRDGKSLFIASKDTYVYKLNVRNGTTPVWKYQTEAVLDTCPRVTREVVYQYARYKGLSAIDKKSGNFIWQLREGTDLLAEANGKAYVITNVGTLVVMDNKKAKRLHSVDLAGVSRYAANVADSKIYIADEAGQIVCLRPVE